MTNESHSTQMQEGSEGHFADLISRLASVVELLERAMSRPEMAASAVASEAVGPIVAMVEGGSREAELAGKLAEAEKTIAQLRASSASREGPPDAAGSPARKAGRHSARTGSPRRRAPHLEP